MQREEEGESEQRRHCIGGVKEKAMAHVQSQV